MRKIAIIPGEGVGAEVIAEAVKVLRAVMERSGLDLELNHFDLNSGDDSEVNSEFTRDLIENLKAQSDAVLLGPLHNPVKSRCCYGLNLLQTLRLELNLYVNICPIRLLKARFSPVKTDSDDPFDFLFIQENLEGINAGIGGIFKRGTDDEQVVQQAIMTRRGIRRIVEYAFDIARRLRRTRITLCNYQSVFPWEINLMTEAAAELQADFPKITVQASSLEDLVVALLREPEQFEIIVTCNTFGNVLTNLGAALQGGLGVTAEANLNPGKTCLVRPIHGPLADQAGKNTASPLASISAVALLLQHFGLEQEVNWVNSAIAHAFATDNIPGDLGGRLSTVQVGDFIADQIKKGIH